MVNDKKKQLAFNIVDFLRTSCTDGTVKEDDKESLEVAISCIAESFGIDPDSSSDKAQYSIAPANLASLLDVYLQTKAKTSSSTGPASTSSSTTTTAAPKATGPSADDRARADALKTSGNALMSSKSYPSAIDAYTQAIAIHADPVYFSNRAAAHGAMGNHSAAAEDAQRAIDLDPGFIKAYSRLGHALFSAGDVKGSVEAYERGLERDGGNANMQQALGVARAKLREQEKERETVSRSGAGEGAAAGAGAGAGAGGMPDLSALAGLMGGGGGGGGGMPDLASLMQNPQMMAMAQQMMGNGGLERMMQNPNIRRMAEQFQSGGGMPDMATLAQDPEMRNLAQQFMGGRQP